MDWPSFITPFLIGLFSGFHCVAMCGGLCAAMCPQNNWRNQLALNSGRIMTYTLLGALAAGLAQGLLWQLDAAWLTLIFRTVLGVMLVVTGVALWYRSRALHVSKGLPFWSHFSKQLNRLNQNNGWQHQWLKGLVWGLLPCGLLYAMLLMATATGDVIRGALLMLFFGLGTVLPLMLSQPLILKLQDQGRKWAALLVILIGVWTLTAPWWSHHLIPQDNPWLLELTLFLERCVP